MNQSSREGRGNENLYNHPNRFPEQLYNLLCNPALNDILCWLPHGKSWIVLNQNAFVEKIIRQKHFFMSDYDNFIQCVNKWGFKQVNSGSDVGSYYHRVSAFSSLMIFSLYNYVYVRVFPSILIHRFLLLPNNT